MPPRMVLQLPRPVPDVILNLIDRLLSHHAWHPHIAHEPADRRLSAEINHHRARSETLKGLTDVLFVAPDPFIFSNRIRINTLALQARAATAGR
jgi:hypothetical protein